MRQGYFPNFFQNDINCQYLPGIDETRYVRSSPSQNTVSSLLALSLTLIFSKINTKSLIFCLSSSGKSWYEDLLDDGLKSTLTVCPSVLSNFKYCGTRPYDSTNQSAVSAFDLNSFIFLDLLFSIINAS
jgi:hypothetical protein